VVWMLADRIADFSARGVQLLPGGLSLLHLTTGWCAWLTVRLWRGQEWCCCNCLAAQPCSARDKLSSAPHLPMRPDQGGGGSGVDLLAASGMGLIAVLDMRG
jgi:hypothetical protein